MEDDPNGPFPIHNDCCPNDDSRPPYFERMTHEPQPVDDITGARVLAVLGDSVTTDHISPAGTIKRDSPAGTYLQQHGVAAEDFNSYGSRRGNHEVMIRDTFANIRLRNHLAPGTEGGALGDGAAVVVFVARHQPLAERRQLGYCTGEVTLSPGRAGAPISRAALVIYGCVWGL